MARILQVIYRTGGRENYKWNIVGERFDSSLLANDKAHELEKMGYPARVHDAGLLASIGLPESFDVTSPLGR